MLKSAARSDSDGKQGDATDDGERGTDDRYCADAGGRTTTTTSRLRRAALRLRRRLRFDRFSLAAAPERAPAGSDQAHAQEGAACSRLWKTTQFSSRRSWRR